MGCYLRVEGRRFDVDAFLSRPGFSDMNPWRKGDLVKGRNPSRRMLTTSGFSIPIITGNFDDLAKQCRYATRFLIRHRRMLQRIGRFKGVEQIYLDFGIRWRETFTHTDSLPRELIVVAGKLGLSISLSHYPIAGKHRHIAGARRCPECGHEHRTS